MKKLIFTVLAVFSFSTAAMAQTPAQVRVTNKIGDAVAVKAVDNPGRHAFQIGFEMNGPTPPEVPAGKVFVIEHISGNIRVPSAFGAPGPCKFYQLSFLLGIDIDVIPVHMGTAAGLSNDFNFFTISQPVRAYAPQGQLGGASFQLSQHCSGFPTWSRIVLTGHLINNN